jgi:pimeloyl-ACP methyl ester carboxylesterase
VHRGRVIGVLAAVLALSAAACGSDATTATRGTPSSSTTTSAQARAYTGADDGFYAVPSPLPAGKHGDLLRYQRLPDVPGGHAFRVLYLSTSVSGKPIAVSGLVAIPSATGTARTVLTFAHGTTGLADSCAPSKLPAATLDAHVQAFLDRGWVVAGTDYEGLGTPGLHPYLAGISEGRGTLDIVRAAGQLPDAHTGPKTLIWGHSQGGHAALFAAQLAHAWTPELPVLGTVAGAPPSELPLIAAALKGGDFQGYLAMAAGGLHAAYPKADLSLVLTPQGIGLLPVLDTGCTKEIFQAFNGISYDQFAKADPATVEPWKTILQENDPGHVVTTSPLLIIHGEADQQIPPIASALLFKRLCGLGQNVERRTYPGFGHAEVIAPSFEPMLAWMDARVAGTPAVSGCPTS